MILSRYVLESIIFKEGKTDHKPEGKAAKTKKLITWPLSNDKQSSVWWFLTMDKDF